MAMKPKLEPKPKQPTDAAIRAMLVMTDGNRTAAADRLCISRITMLRRIRDMTEKPTQPKSSGRPKKKPAPKPAEHLHESELVEQPMISDLLPQGIHQALDRGMDYEVLIHRFNAMVLQIMEGRIQQQRKERVQADAAGKRWTPKRLRGLQDRLVNARSCVDGIDLTEAESDGTDKDETPEGHG